MKNKMTRKLIPLTVTLLFLLQLSPVSARLRLVALPKRDNVAVNLENPEVALVQEERVLSLQKGANEIDFSWQGVKIDQNSIRFKSLAEDPRALTLLSVSYPPDEDALVWQVHSREAMDVPVRISYLLDGIDQIVTYTAVADQDESEVDLRSDLVLRNFSGEDFEHAAWLLGYGDPLESGSRHEETKRVSFFRQAEVPIEKEFTWDAAEKPHEPDREDDAVGIPVHYVIANTEAANLGRHILWSGKVRVFQEDGQDSTIFLGEDRAPFTPVGDKFRLYIGDSRDIVVTQRRMETQRENLRRNNNRNVILYDELRRDMVEIENFRDTAAVLNIIQHMEDQWEMVTCTHEYEHLDYETIEFQVGIDASDEVKMEITYRVKNIIKSAPRPLKRHNSPQ